MVVTFRPPQREQCSRSPTFGTGMSSIFFGDGYHETLLHAWRLLDGLSHRP
jgi:hypothetical protein